MTIEGKIRKILSKMWDRGFIYRDKKYHTEIASQAILALIKPMSREQIEGCLNSVFSDYALNGQGNRNLIKSLADALLELINEKEE